MHADLPFGRFFDLRRPGTAGRETEKFIVAFGPSSMILRGLARAFLRASRGRSTAGDCSGAQPSPASSASSASASSEPLPATCVSAPDGCNRLALNQQNAAEVFVFGLQDRNLTGVFAASEIDELWERASSELCVYHLPPQAIRSELAALGFCLGRRRLHLKHPEVARRTGQDRALVYLIPPRKKARARSETEP